MEVDAKNDIKNQMVIKCVIKNTMPLSDKICVISVLNHVYTRIACPCVEEIVSNSYQ